MARNHCLSFCLATVDATNAIQNYSFSIGDNISEGDMLILDLLCLCHRNEPNKIIPNIKKTNVTLWTATQNYVYSLLGIGNIISCTGFDSSKPVVILLDGWKSNDNFSFAEKSLIKAFRCRVDIIENSYFSQIDYTWLALNVEKYGEDVAYGLEILSKLVPLENIQLLGFSLGAHIAGATARAFTRLTGKKLKTIHGLDPANPCFYNRPFRGLRQGDADFVNIIHTNPGYYGVFEPVGDSDFYPDGLQSLKTGCTNNKCSHLRAVEYFAESVYFGSERNFLGKRCATPNGLECTKDEVPMGFKAPSNVIGIFYLEVNGEKPYGKNATKHS
ncbi:vitellogenin-1-like [Teleopsis dalmanni]|uniref:vitellogenin-1-like n=1 Tax=Teleopsis dalmanni TaxID=139649 RepID=UPI0018CC852C|nr:vitellogenin-1-like [Teleopsis dalmanni]